jgi:hypothetical protein
MAIVTMSLADRSESTDHSWADEGCQVNGYRAASNLTLAIVIQFSEKFLIDLVASTATA